MPNHALPYPEVGYVSLLRTLEISDAALAARLRDGLDRTEARLRACVNEASDPRVTGAVGHLVEAGGKRLRPLLALLGGEFGDPPADHLVGAAALAELIHVASLHHDDVMDRATVRRGRPTVNARFGNAVAVYSGDWLLARGGQIAAELHDGSLALHTQTAERLVAGQLRELLGPGPDDDALAYYLEVIAGKSAALISAALRLGALQGDVPAEVSERLGDYGEQLGIAFQIGDDLIDVTSAQSDSGKQQGQDIASGVVSLPVLLALRDTSQANAELRGLLTAGPVPGSPEHARALALLSASPAVPLAQEVLEQRLDRARRVLTTLPPGPAVGALYALCDLVSRRTN
ncbi:polyprenyl synthetase family protein [Streptomyces sp. DSM 44915]|uniref:Polyprenyl synthetase family protein n=1 Tax=Streptomyces chisholmiae TaxID=3075540 RepID=A0ABU2JZS3_9ACTN|nr:polyprenyl synthetase family protein [Streptomyces sp. DSM 44915]MDT0270496.1 polyprenyl synthetase family protein [Streptomyces sp. DSM 44915]